MSFYKIRIKHFNYQRWLQNIDILHLPLPFFLFQITINVVDDDVLLENQLYNLNFTVGQLKILQENFIL